MGQLVYEGRRRCGFGSRGQYLLGNNLLPASLLLVIALLLAGCNRSDQEIKVYRVVKAPLDSSAPASEAGAPPDAAASSFQPSIVPSNWEPQPLSQMRQASFLVHDETGAVTDISFVTLGPAAGNVLDNVNRWLSQLAQPPVTEEKLATIAQQIPVAGGSLEVVDLTGEPENGDAKKDGRIIAAIAADAQSTAFYKMRGNPELTGREKGNFLKWVRSVRDAHAAGPAPEKAPGPDDATTPKINWEVPAGWTPGAPSAMRYASFNAGEGDEKADISVITFPGEGGSDLDNVNRWRGQIGLPTTDANALKAMIAPMATNEISFSTIDLTGATARTIAAWTRHDGRVWFFKLTGPQEAVEREKPKFVKFIQSVRF